MSFSAEIDRAKEEYRAGRTSTVALSRSAYYSIHTDFRASRGDRTFPSCLVLTSEGTCLVPVTFTDSSGAGEPPAPYPSHRPHYS